MVIFNFFLTFIHQNLQSLKIRKAESLCQLLEHFLTVVPSSIEGQEKKDNLGDSLVNSFEAIIKSNSIGGFKDSRL